MPRLRNTATGVVVSASNEIADRLSGEWELAEKAAPKRPVKK